MYPRALSQQRLGQSWSAAKPVKGQIDPFMFLERVAVYKELMDATNINGLFGEYNETNPLWGLPYQLQWQYDSGRLSDAVGDTQRDEMEATAHNIAADSPWSFGNYSLSIIPYLGAISAGLVPDVAILPPSVSSIFPHAYGIDSASRTVPPIFDQALSDWTQYFTKVAETHNGEDDEPLRILLWQAHKTSLDAVTATLSKVEQRLFSKNEQQFLDGWCKMVDMLAAAAWRTDHPAIIDGGIDVLPDRPLGKNDDISKFADFPEVVQGNINSVLRLARLSDARMHRALWIWRRMMRTRKARDDAKDILHILMDDTGSKLVKLKLLRLLL